jgi:hypothetical protein
VFNAHVSAYPDIDWIQTSATFVQVRSCNDKFKVLNLLCMVC